MVRKELYPGKQGTPYVELIFSPEKGSEEAAILFSGQGRQFVGMGKDLYEKNLEARKLYDQAERHLPYPIREVSFNGPEEYLRIEVLGQLATFIYDAACFRSLIKGIKFTPQYYAGQSLGQITALYAAGAFDLKNVLKFISIRGEAMGYADELNPGGSAAVFLKDPSKEKIFAELRDKEIKKRGLYLEADNSRTQFVICGKLENLQRVLEGREKIDIEGIQLMRLKGGAYHSPLMEPAAKIVEKALEKEIVVNSIETPVVDNSTAKPIQTVKEIKKACVNHLTHTVLWRETDMFLNKKGIFQKLTMGDKNVLLRMAENPKTKKAAIGAIISAGLTIGYIAYRQKKKEK